MIYPEAVVQRCSVKKLFLEISQNSQKNTCARVSFLIKLQARPVTLLKKRLWHRCFPVNFMKFLRAPFSQNTSWRLLLVYDNTEHAILYRFRATFTSEKFLFSSVKRASLHYSELSKLQFCLNFSKQTQFAFKTLQTGNWLEIISKEFRGKTWFCWTHFVQCSTVFAMNVQYVCFP